MRGARANYRAKKEWEIRDPHFLGTTVRTGNHAGECRFKKNEKNNIDKSSRKRRVERASEGWAKKKRVVCTFHARPFVSLAVLFVWRIVGPRKNGKLGTDTDRNDGMKNQSYWSMQQKQK